MLNDIHISNYRTFSSINVDFSTRVNLIVGSNNSGKSSLLEAIYLLTSDEPGVSLVHLLNEKGEVVLRTRRRTSSGHQAPSIFFGRSPKSDQEIIISSKSNNVVSIKYLDVKSIQVQLDLFNDESVPDIGSKFKILVLEKKGEYADAKMETLRVSDDGLVIVSDKPSLSRFASADQRSKFITTSFVEYDELAVLWDGITLTPQEEQVVEALRILESDVERISFTSRQTSNSGILLKMRGEPHPVSLGSLGDGMRRALVIAAALVSVEKGVLLVDEIDTGLYHGVLADIWSLILETSARRNVKVFATTHSWDCVRAFQAALQKRNEDNAGQLIRLEKLKGGLVRPIYYSGDELEIAIQQDIEVR